MIRDESKIEAITQGLFGIPIYKMQFKHHHVLKPQWLEYMSDKENFRRHTTSDRLYFTSAELHKEPIFNPLRDFFQKSLEYVMDDLGYLPNIGMTGMWGTVHPEGGYHHRHTHNNSFLAGIYYLDGNEKSSGTTFYSHDHYNSLIVPARNVNKPSTRFRTDYTNPFEEGSLIIFPAWLHHSTSSNNLKHTEKYRKIISFNAMPLGMTNIDPFDRYNYQDVSNAPLVKDVTELYRYDKDKPSDMNIDNLNYFNQNIESSAIIGNQQDKNEINTLREEVGSLKSELMDLKDLLIKASETK